MIEIFEEVIMFVLGSIAKGLCELEAFDSGEGCKSLSAVVLAHFALGSVDPSVFPVAFHVPLVLQPWPLR